MNSTISTISNKKQAPHLKEYYEMRYYFGTTVWLHCFYDEGIDICKAARACWEKAQAIQVYMNVYAQPLQGSLSWLNSCGYQGVCVQKDVFNILKKSLEYSRLTAGAYDVTIFPLVQLWKNAAKEGHLPDKKFLEEVRALVGWQNIVLIAPDLVFFKKKGMMADLGSPASGYFCDEIAGILDFYNIKHFMVDGGGEIFCRGKNMGLVPWRVGVQDPFDTSKVWVDVDLQDQGVSTSGNYEKFSKIGTETFSHIIDPRTGYPQKGAASATVIAQTTQAANELSTALCVMGGCKGLEFIRTLKNVEALIIENNNGKILQYQTDGFVKKL
ncbi:MAG: FAD:protein FMN transferase [Candidatus Omnitrophica bacterium]|nr:FAD:protein FMN transferase [Candidatus Omnitrophota bacterium]